MTGTRIEIREVKYIDIGPVEEHTEADDPYDRMQITLTDMVGTQHLIVVLSPYATPFRIRNSLRKS